MTQTNKSGSAFKSLKETDSSAAGVTDIQKLEEELNQQSLALDPPKEQEEQATYFAKLHV
ncbi:hypothetical protein PGTUg99_035998 [Puccinia graminis f. sp. tritici]|uniref:Uncharacterized protein n=1 Tax=Puccinia graminis f. sp. tritici TaxID=56615 RepID=A0A5B0S8B5_PUCGR|nr:hypothetical protein PGTUg99_035998 [Puccinia graminis f. sp. tritici]